MALHYVALIRKEEDTDYWVDIPDVPGCVASGKTEEEAKTQFEEALKFHLEGMRKDDEFTLPEPRNRDEVLAAEEDPYLSDYIIEIEPFK